MNHRKQIFTYILAFIVCALPLHLASAQTGTQVGIFKEYQIAPDSRLEVPIEIKGATELYAIDVEMTFDPTLLSAEDADADTPGIQPGLGTFLDAGLTLFNEVDTQTGKVRFVMSQVNPSEAKSGNGVILVVYFKAKAEGESPLTISGLTLSTRDGVEIAAEAVSASVRISVNAPVVVATSVPVQNPASLIIVPTLAPTSTPKPTLAPTPTVAPTVVPTVGLATQQAESVPTVASGGTQSAEVDSSSSSSIWWVLVLAGLVLAGVAIYMFRSGKKAIKTKPGSGGSDGDVNPEDDQPSNPPLG